MPLSGVYPAIVGTGGALSTALTVKWLLVLLPSPSVAVTLKVSVFTAASVVRPSIGADSTKLYRPVVESRWLWKTSWPLAVFPVRVSVPWPVRVIAAPFEVRPARVGCAVSNTTAELPTTLTLSSTAPHAPPFRPAKVRVVVGPVAVKVKLSCCQPMLFLSWPALSAENCWLTPPALSSMVRTPLASGLAARSKLTV